MAVRANLAREKSAQNHTHHHRHSSVPDDSPRNSPYNEAVNNTRPQHPRLENAPRGPQHHTSTSLGRIWKTPKISALPLVRSARWLAEARHGSRDKTIPRSASQTPRLPPSDSHDSPTAGAPVSHTHGPASVDHLSPRRAPEPLNEDVDELEKSKNMSRFQRLSQFFSSFLLFQRQKRRYSDSQLHSSLPSPSNARLPPPPRTLSCASLALVVVAVVAAMGAIAVYTEQKCGQGGAQRRLGVESDHYLPSSPVALTSSDPLTRYKSAHHHSALDNPMLSVEQLFRSVQVDIEGALDLDAHPLTYKIGNRRGLTEWQVGEGESIHAEEEERVQNIRILPVLPLPSSPSSSSSSSVPFSSGTVLLIPPTPSDSFASLPYQICSFTDVCANQTHLFLTLAKDEEGAKVKKEIDKCVSNKGKGWEVGSLCSCFTHLKPVIVDEDAFQRPSYDPSSAFSSPSSSSSSVPSPSSSSSSSSPHRLLPFHYFSLSSPIWQQSLLLFSSLVSNHLSTLSSLAGALPPLHGLWFPYKRRYVPPEQRQGTKEGEGETKMKVERGRDELLHDLALVNALGNRVLNLEEREERTEEDMKRAKEERQQRTKSPQLYRRPAVLEQQMSEMDVLANSLYADDFLSSPLSETDSSSTDLSAVSPLLCFSRLSFLPSSLFLSHSVSDSLSFRRLSTSSLSLPTLHRCPPRKAVFIRRKHQRVVVNYAQLVYLMEKKYEIQVEVVELDEERSEAEEQLRWFTDFGLVVTSFGDHLLNLVYTQLNAVILQLSPDPPLLQYALYAKDLGIKFDFSLGGAYEVAGVQRGEWTDKCLRWLIEECEAGEAACVVKAMLGRDECQKHEGYRYKDHNFLADLVSFEDALLRSLSHLNWLCYGHWSGAWLQHKNYQELTDMTAWRQENQQARPPMVDSGSKSSGWIRLSKTGAERLKEAAEELKRATKQP